MPQSIDRHRLNGLPRRYKASPETKPTAQTPHQADASRRSSFKERNKHTNDINGSRPSLVSARLLAARAPDVYGATSEDPASVVSLPGTLPRTYRDAAFASLDAIAKPAPETIADAATHLTKEGFVENASPSDDVRIFEKDGRILVLVPLKLNQHMKDTATHLDGYVAWGTEGAHAQLGSVTLSNEQWQLLERGFQSQAELYENGILPRSLIRARSVIPLTGSAAHAPHDGVKRYLRGAHVGPELSQKVAEKRKLFQLASRAKELLVRLAALDRLPRQFVIMVEGTDGASKTGNGLALMRILEKMGYEGRTQNFRRPTEGERAHGVEWRYERFSAAAQGALDVALLDRGIPGDFVHNPTADLDHVIAASERLDQTWQSRGSSVLKLLFRPGAEAPIETFGKRLARGLIAHDLLQRRSDLSDGEREHLREAAEFGPGLNDFRSIENAERIDARYQAFADATGTVFPWHIINTASRHAGRVQTLEIFISHLEALLKDAAAAAPSTPGVHHTNAAVD